MPEPQAGNQSAPVHPYSDLKAAPTLVLQPTQPTSASPLHAAHTAFPQLLMLAGCVGIPDTRGKSADSLKLSLIGHYTKGLKVLGKKAVLADLDAICDGACGGLTTLQQEDLGKALAKVHALRDDVIDDDEDDGWTIDDNAASRGSASVGAANVRRFSPPLRFLGPNFPAAGQPSRSAPRARIWGENRHCLDAMCPSIFAPLGSGRWVNSCLTACPLFILFNRPAGTTCGDVCRGLGERREGGSAQHAS